MRVAVLREDSCQPKKCMDECREFCPPVRNGQECIVMDSKTGKPVLTTPGQHVNWIHPESRYPEEWPALWAEQKKAADAPSS